MSQIDTKFANETYTVSTPLFEGPLDLLLKLIERAELDITTLALAQVTDQYIYHIHNLGELHAEEVSSFLVIAARLIQIKSEVLLPKPPELINPEENVGETLARQLLVYKQFKEIGIFLAQRETEDMRTYLRPPSQPMIKPIIKYSDCSSVDDIWNAAVSIFSKIDEHLPLETVVEAPLFTIREKIQLITQRFNSIRRSTFHSLFSSGCTRLDVIITFLAMLELVKMHMIVASQGALFDEIILELDIEWDNSMVFDGEFGE